MVRIIPVGHGWVDTPWSHDR